MIMIECWWNRKDSDQDIVDFLNPSSVMFLIPILLNFIAPKHIPWPFLFIIFSNSSIISALSPTARPIVDHSSSSPTLWIFKWLLLLDDDRMRRFWLDSTSFSFLLSSFVLFSCWSTAWSIILNILMIIFLFLGLSFDHIYHTIPNLHLMSRRIYKDTCLYRITGLLILI